ncbi:MAG: VWA domain-containing protein, partial [Planctomycetota bacterium]
MKGRDLYPWGWWTAGVIGTPVLLLAIGLTIVLIFADEMDFDLARWWWLMGIGPLAGLWILWTVARRRRSVQAFASASLAPLLVEGFSPVRPVWKASLQVAALVMIAWALIGPRWGTYLEKHRVYGVDVVVALDVSKSMLAEDVRPNRLERAKQVIRQQLTERTVLGRANRLALIAFAGSTSLKVPLSTDLSAFRNRLEQLTVGSAPRGGTALAKAIRNAADLFVRSPEKATKVILLFTDGEDH